VLRRCRYRARTGALGVAHLRGKALDGPHKGAERQNQESCGKYDRAGNDGAPAPLDLNDKRAGERPIAAGRDHQKPKCCK
jgi:hypothetical protein